MAGTSANPNSEKSIWEPERYYKGEGTWMIADPGSIPDIAYGSPSTVRSEP